MGRIFLILLLCLAPASFVFSSVSTAIAGPEAPSEAPGVGSNDTGLEYASLAPSSDAADEPAVGADGCVEAAACIDAALPDDDDGPDSDEAAREDEPETWPMPYMKVYLAGAACGVGTPEPAPLSYAYTPYTDAAESMDVATLAQGFGVEYPGVPVVMNKKVESFIKYFQTRGRKHFEKWLSRQPYYMETVQEILRSNGLPDDLFYIALIESGLSPKAKSRAKAVGLWQFIKGTAKKYGLRVDWWVDERMDPIKATEAASRYFKNLYWRFGSWYLAAAGYNAGEGRVSGAIRRHKTDDFWALSDKKRPLKRETREYVPKYIAAMLIAKDPAAYGFEVEPGPSFPAYETVKVTAVTDLHIIADASGATVEEIQQLNPELLRWFTPPDPEGYELKLPMGTAERYNAKIDGVPPSERVKFMQHKVKRGDTLGGIAKRYGVELKSILYMNNIKSARGLKPGSTIVVPVRADARPARKGNSVADGVDVRWRPRG